MSQTSVIYHRKLLPLSCAIISPPRSLPLAPWICHHLAGSATTFSGRLSEEGWAGCGSWWPAVASGDGLHRGWWSWWRRGRGGEREWWGEAISCLCGGGKIFKMHHKWESYQYTIISHCQMHAMRDAPWLAKRMLERTVYFLWRLPFEGINRKNRKKERKVKGKVSFSHSIYHTRCKNSGVWLHVLGLSLHTQWLQWP